MAVGIGFRREIAASLLRAPERVDLIEIIAERALTDRNQRREAIALRELWPVIPHGVSLSLGSAEGIDDDRARALGKLARDLHAPYVTEHASFVRTSEVEIGHLTQLPRTRAAVRVLAQNVARARRHMRLPDACPLLLENVAWSVRWPDDEMDEATFYQEVVRATGCSLLLDVANLYANARNENVDPVRVLDAYPLDAVAMIHVAGSRVSSDGFVFDTHAHPVPPAVFALVERALDRIAAAAGARTPALALILERDRNFDGFETIAGELAHLRALDRGGAPRATPGESVVEPAPDTPREQVAKADLIWGQTVLARALRDGTTPPGFSPIEIERARTILIRKWAERGAPSEGVT